MSFISSARCTCTSSGTDFPRNPSIWSSPVKNTISASSIFALCCADMSKPWGETPAGMIFSTSTYCHPIVLTTELIGTIELVTRRVCCSSWASSILFTSAGCAFWVVDSCACSTSQHDVKRNMKAIAIYNFFIIRILNF